MRTLLLLVFVAIAGAGLAHGQQFGQYPVPNWGPGYRGNISPYLNIIRNNNNQNLNAGINYYLGTRAEQQRRANAQEFRDEIEALPLRDRLRGEDIPENFRAIPSGSYSLMNNTGSYFNNTYNYFSYPGRQGRQPIRPGMVTAPPRRPGAPSRTGMNPGFAPGTTGAGMPRPLINPATGGFPN